MKTLLWLDDLRDPYKGDCLKNCKFVQDYGHALNLVWIKNYEDFVDYIHCNPLPDFISFDHDLGDIDPVTYKEYSGYDCAKFLCEWCMNTKQKLPKYEIHSMNPVGAANINRIITSFSKCSLWNGCTDFGKADLFLV